jgi:hypothetical protein
MMARQALAGRYGKSGAFTTMSSPGWTAIPALVSRLASSRTDGSRRRPALCAATPDENIALVRTFHESL